MLSIFSSSSSSTEKSEANDKEKQSSDKSESNGDNNKKNESNSKNDGDPNNNTDQNQEKDQHQNQDQDQSNKDHEDTKVNEDNNPPPPSSSDQPLADGEPKSDNVEDGDKKDGEEATEEKPAEEAPTAVTPDLAKVSEEIDQFISVISKVGDGDDPDQSDQSSPPEIVEFVDQFGLLVEAKVAECVSDSKKWKDADMEDSSSFLDSLDRTVKLLKALSKFSSNENYDSAINRISGILQRAMSFMELEFKTMLEDYQTSHDREQKRRKAEDAKVKQLSSSSSNVQEADRCELPESSETKPDENDEFLGYSDETLSDLQKLAKAMAAGGHEAECCQLYFFVRRNALENNQQKLGGFEKLSIDDVQKMQWEPLEREIVAWLKTFNVFTTSLLPNERKLAESLFSNDDVSESLFASLSGGVMFNLLNFAEAVSMTKRSAEKLFKFLDIYETLRDRIPQTEKLFSPECLERFISEASLTRTRLGDAIFNIFGELENSIKADTAKTPVPGGAVHPLTRYTMNYLKYACEYKDTLEQVFNEHKKIDRDSGSCSDYDHDQHKRGNHQAPKQSPFQMQLTKVMDLLDANLEAKSKLYKDPSLSLIFMMNNGRYILQKIKGAGEINTLMGDPWVRKRSSDLRSYHTNYKRETWTKLLQCLNHEGLNVNGKVVKPVLKERFKSFNAMFDEIHRTQSTWVVSDEQLQSELRVSISAIVIPAYRSFVGRFSQILTPGRQTEKYIKYQPEDIETCIDELFDGSASAPPVRKR